MHATSEIRRDVVRLLEDNGITGVEFDKDGAGHQVVKFRCGRRTMTFHFPSTGRMNGHSRMNVIARLKRQLREVAPPPPPTRPATITTGAPTVPETAFAPRHSLTREEKIHKRFTAGENPDRLAEEFFITKARLYQVVGEVNARKRGEKPKPLRFALHPRPEPAPVVRQRKTWPHLVDRNKAIIAAFTACRNFSALGRRFGNLTGARIKQILKEHGALTE